MDNAKPTISDRIDRFSIAIGHCTAWLTLLMVVVVFIIVVQRYVFDSGLIWLQESLTWLHAAAFMLGAAYTLQQEEHVRVDIFYREMSARRRALVKLVGVALFIFPMCGFFAWTAWDYVFASWKIGEVSRDAGGLPFPFVPLLKTILIVMPLAVALQGVSLLLRSLRQLRDN
jgi:TRAP-type mannitol/chloroaromatic compound transport system permease small subunit